MVEMLKERNLPVSTIPDVFPFFFWVVAFEQPVQLIMPITRNVVRNRNAKRREGLLIKHRIDSIR